MTDFPENLKAELMNTQIIALALCVGVYLASMILGPNFSAVQSLFSDFELNTSSITAIGVAAGGLSFSQVFFTSYIKRINEKNYTEARSVMTNYKTALIIKMAILEGAAMFNIIITSKESPAISIVCVLTILVAMIISIPTRQKVLAQVSFPNEDENPYA